MRRPQSVAVTVVLAFALAALAPLFAADPQVGVWRINLAKSRYNPAGLAPKSTVVKVDPVANGVKVTVDTTDAANNTIHYDYTAKYDGKEYPVVGDPGRDATSMKKIDELTFEQTNKKSGKVTTINRWVYARDGKSRVQTTTGANPQGEKIDNRIVWDRQ